MVQHTHSRTHSLTHLLAYPQTHLLTHSSYLIGVGWPTAELCQRFQFTHTHLFIHLLSHSLTYSHTHLSYLIEVSWPTAELCQRFQHTHSRNHSLTYLLAYPHTYTHFIIPDWSELTYSRAVSEVPVMLHPWRERWQGSTNTKCPRSFVHFIILWHCIKYEIWTSRAFCSKMEGCSFKFFVLFFIIKELRIN